MYSDVVRFSFECRKLNQNLSTIKITHRNKDKYPRRYNEISQETQGKEKSRLLKVLHLIVAATASFPDQSQRVLKKTKQSTPHQFRPSNGNCCSKASDSVALSFFSFC